MGFRGYVISCGTSQCAVGSFRRTMVMAQHTSFQSTSRYKGGAIHRRSRPQSRLQRKSFFPPLGNTLERHNSVN